MFGNIVSGETLDPGEMKTFFVTQDALRVGDQHGHGRLA